MSNHLYINFINIITQKETAENSNNIYFGVNFFFISGYLYDIVN